jgi:hypothetical protein
MRLRVLHAALCTVAFSSEPQTIAISANPSSRVEARTIDACLPLELVEQYEIVQRLVVNGVLIGLRRRR